MTAGDDPVAFITGASKGLGAAIAHAFAASGARVALAARTAAPLDEIAAQYGDRALSIPLDVSDEDACAAAIRRCEDHFGRIDVLVNNAGLARSSKFLSTDTALWRETMTVDVEAPFWLIRGALPGMLERGDGRVISIASVAARTGFAYVAPYVAAKHALLGLTRALAREFPASGVTFNCVCPYYIDTPMTEATIENIMATTGRTREQATAPLLSPQRRLVETDELTALCLLLASPAGRGITGQAINVDGGYAQS